MKRLLFTAITFLFMTCVGKLLLKEPVRVDCLLGD